MDYRLREADKIYCWEGIFLARDLQVLRLNESELIGAINWALDGESRIPMSCNIIRIIKQ